GPAGEGVAVKVLESPDATRHFVRFRQEFEKQKQAGGHAGVVRCFELGVTPLDGRVFPWYAMEFAAGGDLAGRIEHRRRALGAVSPWDDTEARAAVGAESLAVLAAVAHLHALDIVHRDVKPSNVLIVDGG